MRQPAKRQRNTRITEQEPAQARAFTCTSGTDEKALESTKASKEAESKHACYTA
jgi:translation initiation factor 1 (eIF-1/SUI1)